MQVKTITVEEMIKAYENYKKVFDKIGKEEFGCMEKSKNIPCEGYESLFDHILHNSGIFTNRGKLFHEYGLISRPSSIMMDDYLSFYTSVVFQRNIKNNQDIISPAKHELTFLSLWGDKC